LASSKEQRRAWHALDLIVADEAREAVEYALMEAGALGTESSTGGEPQRITAYFAETPNRESVRHELAEALRIYALPASAVKEINTREVPDDDWLGEWKKNWQPVAIGRFVIAPPWSKVASLPGRVVINIEPGMAFGTGTHETTRLCLAALEKFYQGGSFLDVGTGTGILAIAAAKLFGEARIEVVDNDAEAVEIARENARLNGVAAQMTFHTGTIDDSTASADFVCANLTADVIASLLPALLAVTCGRLVLSGILQKQVDDVIAQLQKGGAASPIEIIQDGEWAAMIL
jgi:ribosomal protein L11 methyltransferase